MSIRNKPKYRCPSCHGIVKASPQGKSGQAGFFPFCSQRCKLIDLGAWLDVEYTITSNSHPQQIDASPNAYTKTVNDKA